MLAWAGVRALVTLSPVPLLLASFSCHMLVFQRSIQHRIRSACASINAFKIPKALGCTARLQISH